MDYERILSKQKQYEAGRHKIHAVTLSSYEKDFEVTFTHHSTAIEGNTLTLMETKVLLEDGISVGGKALREIYEVVNHKKAYGYVKKCVDAYQELTEEIAKEIHYMLMENIMVGGVYRSQEVRISGAAHVPPAGHDMYIQVKNFYSDLIWKREQLNPIEYAAWTHAEFVRIHPFIDGNGRTSRLLMNYQLMLAGFLPISIAKENRLEYYEALEEYAVNENLDSFSGLVAELEERRLDAYIELIEQE